MKKQIKNSEIEVMKILWSSDKPLMASEIAKFLSQNNKSTINAALKSLLDKQFIEVAEIGFSGTVLARKYKPAIRMSEFIRDNFLFDTTFQMISSFIDEENSEDMLNELENVIEKKLSELED